MSDLSAQDRSRFRQMFENADVVEEIWEADAACREYAHISFFAEPGQSLEPAKIVCSLCLVRDECLAFAIEHDLNDGVFGGLSPRERARLGRVAA